MLQKPHVALSFAPVTISYWFLIKMTLTSVMITHSIKDCSRASVTGYCPDSQSLNCVANHIQRLDFNYLYHTFTYASTIQCIQKVQLN